MLVLLDVFLQNQLCLSVETLTPLSPELRLLICCAKLNPSERELEEAQTILASPIHWELFQQLARYHGIASFGFRALRNVESVPQPVLERLCELAKQTAVRNLSLIDELIGLNELCRRHGIGLMPYKGPALSAIIYGDLCVRDTSDLDFLIRPQDFWRLTRLFLARGYLPEQGIPSSPDERYLCAISECGFVNPATGIRIDAHWHIAPRHLGVRIGPHWFWDKASQVEINGVVMPAMSTEKLILALSIHGAKHGWERLKWLCDFANLLRANPTLNWSEIAGAAVQVGANRMLALALWLAHCLCEVPLPTGYVLERSTEILARDCIELLKHGRPGQNSPRRRWLFLWKLQPGWIYKTRAVWRFFLELEPGMDQEPLSSVFNITPWRRMFKAAGTLMMRN